MRQMRPPSCAGSRKRRRVRRGAVARRNDALQAARKMHACCYLSAFDKIARGMPTLSLGVSHSRSIEMTFLESPSRSRFIGGAQSPRVEPEGMLFRKPVSTPDQVRGRLFG